MFTFQVTLNGTKRTYQDYERAYSIYHRISRWNRHGAKHNVMLSQFKNGKFIRVMFKDYRHA